MRWGTYERRGRGRTWYGNCGGSGRYRSEICVERRERGREKRVRRAGSLLAVTPEECVHVMDVATRKTSCRLPVSSSVEHRGPPMMASSSSSYPVFDPGPLTRPAVLRSNSIQSNATSSSNCSLTRQPRIRARSKTVTSNASARRNRSGGPNTPPPPVTPTRPLEDVPPVPDTPFAAVSAQDVPVRPPRSPMRFTTSPVELTYDVDDEPMPWPTTGPGRRTVDDVDLISRGRVSRDEEAAEGSTVRALPPI